MSRLGLFNGTTYSEHVALFQIRAFLSQEASAMDRLHNMGSVTTVAQVGNDLHIAHHLADMLNRGMVYLVFRCKRY